MPTVIPVKFKYATRDLWFDVALSDALEGDHVICSTERGNEIGIATADPQEMDEAQLRKTIGEATLKPVVRVATDADLEQAERLADLGDKAMPIFRDMVTRLELDMKPVGVEYLFGGGKVICYFSADERVDFRQLVRDLSRELRQRIDMRQIGVREEAAVIGGYAHCGQELCCARFGRQFEPVSIRMAKEQDLPLNSSKISGACGRLMCCLRYEFEAYRDFKTRAPKRNAVIDTPLGKGKIVEYDTPKEQICLRLENGKLVRVALADMQTSEAAHKKSEELNCPCRPDTVPRSALERLESPEIKMALAELDRKNGILSGPDVDEADLFVEARRPRRKRKGNGQDAAPVDAGRRERAAEGGTTSAENGTSRARRRRRTASGESSAATQVTPENAQPQAGRRRRRHHQSANEATPASATATEAREGQDAKPKPKGMQPKRRRRPGDKGGAAAQDGQQPARPKHAAPKTGQPTSQDQAPTEGEHRHRRRRRRHGRGKGGSGEPGQGTSQQDA
jgi:cell fate regulator YaaT (PSP1 superfamily)